MILFCHFLQVLDAKLGQVTITVNVFRDISKGRTIRKVMGGGGFLARKDFFLAHCPCNFFFGKICFMHNLLLN